MTRRMTPPGLAAFGAVGSADLAGLYGLALEQPVAGGSNFCRQGLPSRGLVDRTRNVFIFGTHNEFRGPLEEGLAAVSTIQHTTQPLRGDCVP